MNTIIKKITTILTVFALVFTAMPMMSGNIEVHAASKPAQVKNVKISYNSNTGINTITWSKVKGASGYQIYRAPGVYTWTPSYTKQYTKWVRIKTLTAVKYQDGSFTSFCNNGYKVRAYKHTYRTQYYNSKTKKWQNKKPAKKYYKACPSGTYKGKKTRKVVKSTSYGKWSAIKGVKNSGSKAWLDSLVPKITTPVIVITFDPTITTSGNKTIGVGNTYNLNVKSNSGGTITCSSNNTAVATVSNAGVVTGKGIGTATITISVGAKGSYKKGSITVTIKVTDTKFVNSSIVPNTTTYNLSDGSTTLTLDSQYGAKWTSSDTSIVTTSTGVGSGFSNKITFLKAGTVTITATSLKDTSLKKTITLTIKDDTPSTVVYSDFSLNRAGRQNPPPSVMDCSMGTLTYGVVLPTENCTVEWTSSNSKSISVNGSGTSFSITAKKPTVTTQTVAKNIVIKGVLKNAPSGYKGPTELTYTIENTGYPREGTTSTGNIYRVKRENGNIYIGDYKDNDFVFTNMPSGSTFKVNASQWVDTYF